MKYIQRYVFVATITCALLIGSASGAFAHGQVEPKEAKRGSATTFTFKFPNEDQIQSTVKIEIEIPQDSPILYVEPMSTNGWTSSTSIKKLDNPIQVDGKKINKLVKKVTFEGGKISGDSVGEFLIKLDVVPQDKDELVFRMIQTYDGGKISKWVEEPIDGVEPEHPSAKVALVGEKSDTVSTTLPKADTGPDQVVSKDPGSSALYIIMGIIVVALIASGVVISKKAKTN